MEQLKHRPGDQLYIPSAYYCSRGSDDVEGGIATIKYLHVNKELSEDHPNRIFVEFHEHPQRSLNYQYVLENQDEWAKEYAGKIAHPCPDVDRPWIENGDTVNGVIWDKGDVW